MYTIKTDVKATHTITISEMKPGDIGYLVMFPDNIYIAGPGGILNLKRGYFTPFPTTDQSRVRLLAPGESVTLTVS